MAAHHYSVRGLAAALGCSPRAVQCWRDGSRAVPADLPQRLERLRQPYEYLSLSMPEACLLVDAMAGHWWDAGTDARTAIMANIYDSLGLPDSQGSDLAAKWEVADPRGLLMRLASLSDAQMAGLAAALKAVMASGDDDIMSALQAHGLI